MIDDLAVAILGLAQRTAASTACWASIAATPATSCALNPRRHYPRVDDKLLTKQICQARGIPRARDLRRDRAARRRPPVSSNCSATRQEFVIKPAKAAADAGSSWSPARRRALHHLQRPASHAWPTCATTCPRSCPGCTRWAASRTGRSSSSGSSGTRFRRRGRRRHARHPHHPLPLRAGDGHGAAADAGVARPGQSAPGRRGRRRSPGHRARPSAASARAGPSSEHPDTGEPIAGLQIPDWDAAAGGGAWIWPTAWSWATSASISCSTPTLGPVVLEANARPGLAIQVANRHGLVPRLDLIDAQPPARLRPEQRCELLHELAGVFVATAAVQRPELGLLIRRRN